LPSVFPSLLIPLTAAVTERRCSPGIVARQEVPCFLTVRQLAKPKPAVLATLHHSGVRKLPQSWDSSNFLVLASLPTDERLYRPLALAMSVRQWRHLSRTAAISMACHAGRRKVRRGTIVAATNASKSICLHLSLASLAGHVLAEEPDLHEPSIHQQFQVKQQPCGTSFDTESP
jgi:hypothetical protein